MVVVAVGLAAGLSACSSGPTKGDACAALDTQLQKLLPTLSMAYGATTLEEFQQVATDSKPYVAGIREVGGPADFMEHRDALADSLDELVGAMETATAGLDVQSQIAAFNGPAIDMQEYCGWQ